MLRTIKAKDLVLSIAAALLLVLSFPIFNLEFLAWAAFVPLLVALENKSKLQAFVLAYISGVVFWLGAIYWLVHVAGAGMFVPVLYLALYWGVFGYLISWHGSLKRGSGIFFIPALWVILEYCRSYALTGFPWALLAYSQSQALAVIQFADITGAWGVSFLVMAVNSAAYIIFIHLRNGKPLKKLPVIIACCLFLCAYLYGAARLHFLQRPQPQGRAFKISVVQGNIPQELKWDSRAQEYIMRTYSGLSQSAAGDDPDLIVWPEAAVPAIMSEGSEYQRALQKFCAAGGINLLTGVVTARSNAYYNSAFLFQPHASPGKYDKIHLVPFGEYIPLRKVFGFLETIVPIGEVERGSEYRVFRLEEPGNAAAFAFSALICYEDVFPELSRRMVNKGAQLLITVTNDAWYRETSAPYQHFQASVFRAVENRVWMVRSANTGVSGFVRPDGTVDGLVSDAKGKTIFVPGYLTRDVRLSGGRATVYTKFGDWFIIAALIMVILCGLGSLRLPGGQRHR